MAVSRRERTDFRLTVAERETPRALAVTGVFFVAITLVNALFGPSMPLRTIMVNGAVAVLLLGGAALVRAPFMRARAWPWVTAVCALALVVAGLAEVWSAPDGSSFAYVLLIVVAYGPLTLAWIPALTATVPMIAGCAIVATAWPGDQATDWVIASLAAIAIGMALLGLRLRGIDEMAELTAQVLALATRDQLTGTLNRRGLDERLPELVGTAARRNEPIFAVFVDIIGLKRANDEHGHHFGDRIIACVADGLRAAVRSGDLLARWGGDEFVILGLGQAPDPDAFTERVLEGIRRGGIDISGWSLGTSVGTATASSDALDVGLLIREADGDMYARRRAHREG